jgi:hypothetical protein
MDRLKLLAFDAEDLAVISAHLQDAVVKLADMTFLPREGRFALVANRFDWESAATGEKRRRRTGLHFDRVRGAKRLHIAGSDADTVLNLLAVTFEETDAPGGAVTLVFSDDRAVRLEVECLEAAMSDLGPMWSTEHRPEHFLDKDPA